MPKARSGAGSATAVDLLERATLARSSGLRAKYATRGLAKNRGDKTTHAMLLRQLYLSHMEGHRFQDALTIALEMVETGVMPDVARQDAARACLGLDQHDRAFEHLRIASRVGPASRRAFHLWTLGSLLYLLGRHREAVGALSRASRWSTTAKPLYLAQLALAQRAAGDDVRGLSELQDRLEEAPCGQGYGQFVLGELAFHRGEYSSARRYLEGFVRRATSGRVALFVALRVEVNQARQLLRRLREL